MIMLSQLFNPEHLLSTYGYIGVFVVVFLESGVFFALPGDSLLFTAGLLATGVGFNLYFLIPLIFVATFLGGIGGYYIGVYLDTLRRYAFFRKILKEEYLETAHQFFEKHGKWAIILSRFVPVVRTFAPVTSGVARMNKSLYIRYSLIGSLLWSTIITLAGFFLGRAFPQIKDYLSYFIIGIIFVSILPGIIAWIRKRRRG
ncbi:MAG: putative rane-associated protein [Parcubacteria group bacterium]|nr:putative rane-associated protein [Parcubacteria group bacterium]